MRRGRYISADPLNHALNGAPVTATTLRGGTTAPFSAKLAWLNQPVLPDMMAITAPVALNRPQVTQWLPDQTGRTGLPAVNAGQSIRGMGLFPDGPNLYAYARQAPGKNTDPTGLETPVSGFNPTWTTSSRRTLRLFDMCGKPALDIDVPGHHYSEGELHFWNSGKRGMPNRIIPLQSYGGTVGHNWE